MWNPPADRIRRSGAMEYPSPVLPWDRPLDHAALRSGTPEAGLPSLKLRERQRIGACVIKR